MTDWPDSWDKWNPSYIYGLLEKAVGKEHKEWWMEQPNYELDGKTPNDLIEEGREKVVLELIVDMITGAPS